ncbi:MAG: alcohol dehydrogenase catalytic domain-containing protein [Chloroflexi bacterium]|nr:alcohol dehydrogenase catalytic domain-containing protein [Chloroflexota bacterium]
MKAAVKTREGVGIEYLDWPKPTIRPDQVLLQVTGCGICGGDLDFYDWTPKGRVRASGVVQLPRIPGHEPAGIVAEVGSAVTQDLKAGDRVACDSIFACGECYACRAGQFNLCRRRKPLGSMSDGAMAEYVVVSPFHLYKIPDGVRQEEAPMLEPLGVAVRAIEVSSLKPGDDVVVIGAGAIGLLEAMVARASGAGRTWIIGRTRDKRLELAQNLGFETLASAEEPVVDIINTKTGGMGVDIVFDATTTGAGREKVQLLRCGGQLVVTASTEGPVNFEGADLRRLGEPSIIFHMGRRPTTFQRSIKLLASGAVDVKPLMTRMPLSQVDKAFQILKKREAMKIILEP